LLNAGGAHIMAFGMIFIAAPPICDGADQESADGQGFPDR
jgi:hypothetical protein